MTKKHWQESAAELIDSFRFLKVSLQGLAG